VKSDQPPTAPGAAPPGERERPGGTFGRWLRGLASALLCGTVGMLLVILPWGPGWDQNYFSGSDPRWYTIWMNPYLRGALSGVGVVNLYLALVELSLLVRKRSG